VFREQEAADRCDRARWIGGIAGAFVGTGEKPPRRTATREYAVVEARDMEILAEAAGQIEPIRVVEVKSKASGDVLQLHVETGDFVRQGTLLAAIDPRDVRNAYDQAEADLEVARARLATSEAQKKRVEELRRANVVTEQEYESAQLEEANARAQYIKANQPRARARANERRHDPRADRRHDHLAQVEVGQIIASASQNISGGTTLFMMADLSEMQVRALIDETDLGRIEPGRSRACRSRRSPAALSRHRAQDRAAGGRRAERHDVPGTGASRQPRGPAAPGHERRCAGRDRNPAQRHLTVPNAAVVGIRDAVPAGAVLGLSEERMQQALRGARAAPLAPSRPNGQRANDAVASGGGISEECRTLRSMRDGGRGRERGGPAKLAACRRGRRRRPAVPWLA
jgi:HlyD family secretion protein